VHEDAMLTRGTIGVMSELLDRAVDTLRALPKNMQEAAARAILDHAAALEEELSSV
jgi:hypothetical protein